MNKITIFLLLICGGLLVAACGGDSSGYSPEMVAQGETVYAGTCIACHGPDAKGLPNLGKDLTTSQFIRDQSDEDLLAFVKQGRPPGDPLNTTGVDMPPKGGNPALMDDDIKAVIAYIRSLQE